MTDGGRNGGGGEEKQRSKTKFVHAVWSGSCDLLNTPSNHHSTNIHSSTGEAHASTEEENLPDLRQQSPPYRAPPQYRIIRKLRK